MEIPTSSAVCAGGGDLTYDLNLGQYICTHTHPQVSGHILFWACFLVLFAAFVSLTTFWLIIRKPITIRFPPYFGGLVAKLTASITFIINAPQNPIVLGKSTITGTVGTPISDNIGISGGNGGPYTVTVGDPTTLPAGVALNPDGSVTGTPTQATPAGGVSVGITVADSNG